MQISCQDVQCFFVEFIALRPVVMKSNERITVVSYRTSFVHDLVFCVKVDHSSFITNK